MYTCIFYDINALTLNFVFRDFGSEKMDPVNELLQNIYTCNFTSVTRAVADNITSEYSGGHIWKAMAF
jgi:hypothetical protein